MPMTALLSWYSSAPAMVQFLGTALVVAWVVTVLFAWAYRQYALSWRLKAILAENEVRRYAAMLGDAITDSAAQEAKADAMMAQLTPRMLAIEEARAKCANTLSDDQPVGTFADPVYLQRPDAKQDDWAWVATIDELTARKGA